LPCRARACACRTSAKAQHGQGRGGIAHGAAEFGQKHGAAESCGHQQRCPLRTPRMHRKPPPGNRGHRHEHQRMQCTEQHANQWRGKVQHQGGMHRIQQRAEIALHLRRREVGRQSPVQPGIADIQVIVAQVPVGVLAEAERHQCTEQHDGKYGGGTMPRGMETEATIRPGEQALAARRFRCRCTRPHHVRSCACLDASAATLGSAR